MREMQATVPKATGCGPLVQQKETGISNNSWEHTNVMLSIITLFYIKINCV